VSPSEVEAINAAASVLMKRGIQLMGDARSDSIRDALACFDEALAMRSKLPMEGNPILRFGLAACWLNRADALTRMGDAAQISAALSAYDEGIGLLLLLPLDQDPRFPRRLAIAHQNRGLTLQRQGPAFSSEAIAAFTDAISVLSRPHAALIPDRGYLLAAIWVNLADAFSLEGSAESESSAQDAARRAMALVAELEETDADAAEVGLKARHAVCRTLATRLSRITSDEKTSDEVHETTDIVDDGLGLVRRWEQKGVVRFRAIAYDLFRFGARFYARFQPQFLNEFVLDNIDPAKSSPGYVKSREMRAAAREAFALSPPK
jgi:hypothetical protein